MNLNLAVLKAIAVVTFGICAALWGLVYVRARIGHDSNFWAKWEVYTLAFIMGLTPTAGAFFGPIGMVSCMGAVSVYSIIKGWLIGEKMLATIFYLVGSLILGALYWRYGHWVFGLLILGIAYVEFDTWFDMKTRLATMKLGWVTVLYTSVAIRMSGDNPDYAVERTWAIASRNKLMRSMVINVIMYVPVLAVFAHAIKYLF